MFAQGFLLAWLVLTLLGLAFTAWLVRHFWKSGKLTTPARKLVALLVSGSALFGGVSTLLSLVMAFGAISGDGESVDPSQKARILAEGISGAMNCTAFSLITWLPSTIALLVVTRGRTATAQRD